jgi:ABC-type multidrug transport system permease subunit
MVPSPEVVNNATFIVLFPLTFIANTFVPSNSLPGVLRTIAEWNPVSTLTHAVRVRFGNLPAETLDPTSWPLQNAMLYSLGWAVLLILVFAPIATRLYQRTEKR